MSNFVILGLICILILIIGALTGLGVCKVESPPPKEVIKIQPESKVVLLEPISNRSSWEYQFSNNPINIKRLKANDWLGSVKGNQGKFEEFIYPSFGIRASIKVILANIRNTETVRAFVYRIAIDNNDEVYRKHIKNYVRYLELELGYKGKIRERDSIKVLKAMIFLEGGQGAVEYFNKYLECKQLEQLI